MNKKIALALALLASLAIGVGSASAASVKATGSWQVDAVWGNNFDFNNKAEDKTFDIQQRMRTAFTFIANENLKGVLDTQIGTNNWGNGLYSIGAGRAAGIWAAGANSGSTTATNANNGGNGNIMLRQGYVDFKLPNTKVNFKVGFQTLALPSAFGIGSPVLDDQVAAAVVSAPITDNISVLGGYARLFDSQNFGSTGTAAYNGKNANTDAVFLAVPVNFSGVSVVPYAMYAYAGGYTAGANTGAVNLRGFGNNNANQTADSGVRAYWGGLALTMTAFDPFKIMADFNYGKATYNSNRNVSRDSDGGRTGWHADLAIDYTGLKMMTPELFFTYSSGENGEANSTKSERMPVVGNPQNFAYGSFWLQGGDLLNSGISSTDRALGFWAVGLSLKDIKLIDKLSHTVHLIYFKGTNDPDFVKNYAASSATASNTIGYGNLLTSKDSLVEFDLNTKYQIYDELALGLELGYINASFNKDTWRNVNAGFGTNSAADAYKAALTLNYAF